MGAFVMSIPDLWASGSRILHGEGEAGDYFAFGAMLGGYARARGWFTSTKKLLWGTWNDYPKVTQDGQEYALIGDRLYSEHAVTRMQPSGMRYPGGGPGSNGGFPQIQKAGPAPADDYDFGRSVAPRYVEDAIRTGTVGAVQANGNTPYTSGSLKVILSPKGAVVTIITLGSSQ